MASTKTPEQSAFGDSENVNQPAKPLAEHLPLSDFEWYMLCDDRPSHPMVFVIAAQVCGCLKELPFREAVAELIQSQPLLRRLIAEIHGQYYWVPATGTHECVHWQSVTADAIDQTVPQVTQLNPRREIGIRIEVTAAPERARIVLHLHHVCCDGIAGVQLMGELLARYGQKTAGTDRQPVFEPPRDDVLMLREDFEPSENPGTKPRRSLRVLVGKIARMLLRRPSRIATSVQRRSWQADAKASGNQVPPDTAAVRSAFLDRQKHRQLRAIASVQNVSLNDLMLREMILHVRSWNQDAGQSRPGDWIRIAMPLSMRTSRHNRIPACNLVSYALVTRRVRDCDHPDELLKSIHRQTGNVLFHREGMIALRLFRIVRRMPFGMKLFLGMKSCMSTMVFANVGDARRRFSGRFPLQDGLWVAGSVVVERLYGVAPVRPNTHASVSVGEYAGELSISLRTDGSVISENDSMAFLSGYLQRLETLTREQS